MATATATAATVALETVATTATCWGRGGGRTGGGPGGRGRRGHPPFEYAGSTGGSCLAADHVAARLPADPPQLCLALSFATDEKPFAADEDIFAAPLILSPEGAGVCLSRDARCRVKEGRVEQGMRVKRTLNRS